MEEEFQVSLKIAAKVMEETRIRINPFNNDVSQDITFALWKWCKHRRVLNSAQGMGEEVAW